MLRKMLLGLFLVLCAQSASAFLHLAGNGNVSTTTMIGNAGGDQPLIIAYKVSCTNAGVAGSVQFTMNWTDPYLGAQTMQLAPLSLLSLGASQYMVFPMNQKDGTSVTYSVAVTGLLGSPTYDIQLLYSSAA